MPRSDGWSRRMAATRRQLTEVALALFEERGFDQVSIAEIAAAAGVGERTVYRYFTSKERIVLEEQPDAFGAFMAALHRAPPELSPVEALSLANRSFAPPADEVELDGRRAALILTTPTLHSAWLAMLADLEGQMRVWLAERTGLPADSIELRAAAAALLGVHRTLVEQWDGTDVEGYLDHADRALTVLERGLGALGTDARARPPR